MKNFRNGHPLSIFIEDIKTKASLLSDVRKEILKNDNFDYKKKNFKRTSKKTYGFWWSGCFTTSLKSEAFDLVMEFLLRKPRSEKNRFINSLKTYYKI